MLVCPLCGSPETDRFDIEGRRYVVFGCMFTPAVDPLLTDDELARRLHEEFGEGKGTGYFRQTCDRLHVYVTKGDGARQLTSESPDR